MESVENRSDVGGVGQFPLDVVAHLVAMDIVAVAYFKFYVSVFPLMKIVVERHAPLEAVLLEGVTAPEPQRYFFLLRKLIVGTEIYLVGDATLMVVAHI